MPRFFLPMASPARAGDSVKLGAEDTAHLRRSLRRTVGDDVLLCDGRSTEYLARITAFEEDGAVLTVQSVSPCGSEPSLFLTLYQGLPKGDKMDGIIQKAVELGVSRVVPVCLERSVPRLGENAPKKQRRWQAIAREAAGQSGRGIVPEVSAPLSFAEAAARLAAEPTVVCYEGGGAPLSSLVAKDCRALSLVIGPEGGISPAEMETLLSAGARAATLGPRILRCETAPLAAISVILALTGNLGERTGDDKPWKEFSA